MAADGAEPALQGSRRAMQPLGAGCEAGVTIAQCRGDRFAQTALERIDWRQARQQLTGLAIEQGAQRRTIVLQLLGGGGG